MTQNVAAMPAKQQPIHSQQQQQPPPSAAPTTAGTGAATLTSILREKSVSSENDGSLVNNIDFETPNRVRVQGEVTLSADDPEMARYPRAGLSADGYYDCDGFSPTSSSRGGSRAAAATRRGERAPSRA